MDKIYKKYDGKNCPTWLFTFKDKENTLLNREEKKGVLFSGLGWFFFLSRNLRVLLEGFKTYFPIIHAYSGSWGLNINSSSYAMFCQVALYRKFDLETNKPYKSKSSWHHLYANWAFCFYLWVKHYEESDYTAYIWVFPNLTCSNPKYNSITMPLKSKGSWSSFAHNDSFFISAADCLH